MRGLEFRAWDEDIKSYINYENSDQFAIGLNGKLIDIGCKFTSQIKEVSKGIVIEQFTGLADVNGVKIFEGDTLRCPDGHKYDVVFDSSKFVAVNPDDKLDFYFLDDFDFEVIGNIHENKDE